MKADNPQLGKLPDTPGVYFFLGSRQEILYIGRATSLRDRVKSYFSADLEVARGGAMRRMVEEARSVDFQRADSVLEAMILEASLIKTHKPRYNVREKDDRSYNYLVITKEEYPRVLVVRGKELDQKFGSSDIKYVFGPFPRGGLLKEALRIVRKVFPFRDTCTPSKGKSEKLCFNAQLGFCPGVCGGRVAKTPYNRTINHVRLLFEGRKKKLVAELRKEMQALAKRQRFERANEVKRKIFALEHINDVTLLKRDIRDLPRGASTCRIEAYDVAHTSGKEMVGVMVVVEDGETKQENYRKFRIRSVDVPNDTAALAEILRRRLGHDEWRLPNMVVVDGGKAQINAAKSAIREFGYMIPVVSVVKDERHRPKEIMGSLPSTHVQETSVILANTEAHRFAVRYHRKRRKLLKGVGGRR